VARVNDGESRSARRAARLAQEPLRPSASPRGFAAGAPGSLKEIWGRRELLLMLVQREIRARYKDSSLGLVWSLARPLISLLIYYVAIGRFLGAERAIPDFAIFVFAGLTFWQLFSEIVSTGTGSIVANSGIIKKVYLPREIFPLSAVGSALFNFSIQLGILLVGALAFRGLAFDWRLLYAPLSIALLLAWAGVIALVLSALNVYLRDIQYLVDVALLIGFWASPIVYSWSMVEGAVSGGLRDLYLANPVTLAVLGAQRAFWISGEGLPAPDGLGVRMLASLAVGLVALLLAQRVFAALQSNLAQEL
jgi:ABC-2 type transport system permease protein